MMLLSEATDSSNVDIFGFNSHWHFLFTGREIIEAINARGSSD